MLVHLGAFNGQGAVCENRDFWQSTSPIQLVNGENNGLRSTHTEGRYNQLTSTCNTGIDDFFQHGIFSISRIALMFTTAVSTFRNQIIEVLHGHGVWYQFGICISQIPGEANNCCFVVVFDRKTNACCAQNMPGLMQTQCKLIAILVIYIVRQTNRLIEHFGDVFFGIQGLHFRHFAFVEFFTAVFPNGLLLCCHFHSLNVQAIVQQKITQL